MNDRQKAYVRAWLSKAFSDQQNAEIIMATKDSSLPLDTVCFHCQQSVEKLLKAYLVYKEKGFPFSHNLGDLVEICKCAEPDFATIQRQAEILTPYAVEIRYPDDFHMPEMWEAREALEIVQHIRGFIVHKIPVEIREPEKEE